MRATVINPYGKKKKKGKRPASKKRTVSTYTRSAMAKKKKGRKRSNPSNPRKRTYRRRRRNPIEGIADILIGGVLAAGGAVACKAAAEGISKLMSDKSEKAEDANKRKNILQLVSSVGGSLLLPRLVPRQYAMPLVHGMFAALGLSILNVGFGVAGSSDVPQLEVQRIIDEIDNRPVSGLITEDPDGGVVGLLSDEDAEVVGFVGEEDDDVDGYDDDED